MSNINMNSFEELEEFLKNWINFHNEGTYDFNGILYLVKACLSNLSKYSIPDEYEELEEFFTEKEIKIMKLIIANSKENNAL